MKFAGFFVPLFLGLLLFGCVSQAPSRGSTERNQAGTEITVQERVVAQYVCPDGSIQNSSEACSRSAPAPIVTTQASETTAITAAPTQPITPALSLLIVSPTDQGNKIHNSVVEITNNGDNKITDLVFDVELYKDGQLVLAETGALYLISSADIFGISSVEARSSVRGHLNLFWYNNNIPHFTDGTYTLKVIVRKGADATPLASDQKDVIVIDEVKQMMNQISG